MKYNPSFANRFPSHDSGITLVNEVSPTLISVQKKLNHIYWFAYFNMNCPSVRYRGKYVLEYLNEKHGIAYSIIHPGYRPKEIFLFLKTYFSVLFFRKKNSIIVFQKIYTRGLYATALKILLLFRNHQTVYDIDDAEYLRFPAATVHFFMRHCQNIFVGSKALADYAGLYNRCVKLLTSPVILHEQVKTKRNKLFTVGWIGFYNTPHESSKPFSHKTILEQMIFPAILQVDFSIRFTVLGVTNKMDADEIREYFFPNPNVQVEIPENIDWLDEAGVYSRVKEFDAGVAPLLDCEMHRAKSAFRIKQYLSCGVPVLANDVGENKLFVKDGFNGFLCSDSAAFKEGLVRLKSLEDDAYHELSSNAHLSIPLFSMKSYCYDFLQPCL
ncbi:MAG: glycosyltransferase [Chitinophagales bacterium]